MNQLIPLPFTKCFVRTKFLSHEDTVMPCYLVACEVVLNEAIRWMVLLENGAMYNSVPLHALCWDKDAPEVELSDVTTWDCLGNRAEIVTLDFVRNFKVETQLGSGRYLFSLHFESPHYWQALPEQLKVCHFIEREDGNYAITVNNQSKFACDAILVDTKLIPKSNERIYFAET